LPAPEFARQRDEGDTGIPAVEDEIDYRDLFDDAPFSYLVLDMAGTVVHANASFFRLIKRDLDSRIDFGFRTLLTSAGAIFFDTQLLPKLLLNMKQAFLFRSESLCSTRQSAAYMSETC
jgi:PAS domain-containing protein